MRCEAFLFLLLCKPVGINTSCNPPSKALTNSGSQQSCRAQNLLQQKDAAALASHAPGRFSHISVMTLHVCSLNTQTQKYPASWKTQKASDVRQWLPLRNSVVARAAVSAQIATGGTCRPDVITPCCSHQLGANCAQTVNELQNPQLFSITEKISIIYWPLSTLKVVWFFFSI